MKRKYLARGAVIAAVILIVLLVGYFSEEEVAPVSTPVPIPVAPEADSGIVDFDKYNYDYVDENVKGILSRMIGANGKTAFYLPPTGYVNVSRGTKYGIAFALNNPNPSGAGVNWEQYNSFEYDWNVDPSVVENCGVSVVEAQKWIERGWSSWGKMAQGWVDHMTIYFSFPLDIEPCTIQYNFVITKDDAAYDSKSVLINLI